MYSNKWHEKGKEDEEEENQMVGAPNLFQSSNLCFNVSKIPNHSTHTSLQVFKSQNSLALFVFLLLNTHFRVKKWWCGSFLATMPRLSTVDQNHAAAYFFSVTQVQFGPRHRSSTWNHAVARFCFCWKLISSQANELLQCVLASFHSSWLLTWPGFNFLNTFDLQNT